MQNFAKDVPFTQLNICCQHAEVCVTTISKPRSHSLTPEILKIFHFYRSLNIVIFSAFKILGKESGEGGIGKSSPTRLDVW